MRHRLLLRYAIVILAASQCLTSRGASGAQKPVNEFSVLYEKLRDLEEENLVALRQNIVASPQIGALIAGVNAASTGPNRNEDATRDLLAQLNKDFPEASFLWESGDPPYESDSTKIRTLIEKELQRRTALRLTPCFDLKRRAFVETVPCRERLIFACAGFGGDGRGGITTTLVDGELSMRDVSISSLDQLNSESAVGWQGAYCKLASLAGQSFVAKHPAGRVLESPRDGSAFAWLFEVPSRPDSVKKECLAFDIAAAKKRLDTLEKRFPALKEDSLGTTDHRTQIDDREARCSRAVESLCESAYVLSGEVILAFRTKNCTVREVTTEDVDADVKKGASQGMPRAIQLNHLQLKETIGLCQTAFDRGYRWDFKRPSTDGCVKPGEARR